MSDTSHLTRPSSSCEGRLRQTIYQSRCCRNHSSVDLTLYTSVLSYWRYCQAAVSLSGCDLKMAKLSKFSLFTFLFGIISTVTGSDLELTSTSNGNPVYPEQEVTFTCVTRGSPTLAWSSIHYIGEGVLMEFLSINTQGTTKTSIFNNETIGTLTHVDGSALELESTLRIVISPMYTISTVSCISVGHNLRKNITLHVLDTPAQEMNISLQRQYACPGDRISFVCTTRSSSILAWNSNEYIGHHGEQLEILSVYEQGRSITSDSNPNTSAVLDSTSTKNGRTDITSTLSIVVLTNLIGGSREHTVTCINVSIGTRETITFSVANCNNSNSITTASPTLPTTVVVSRGGEGSHVQHVITAVVISLVFIITIASFIFVIVVIRKCEIKKEQGVKEKQNEFMTELQPHLDQQWRLFGEKAGIKKKVLKKIGKNPSQDSRLAQVLDHWLRNSKKERTWADIIIILRGMNHRQLANRIKSKKIDLEESQHMVSLNKFSALRLPLTHNDKWREFGKAVGIEKEVLDSIAELNKDHRASKMLEHWLKRETKEPIEVVDILKEIGCTQAARDIERIYKNVSPQSPSEVKRQQPISQPNGESQQHRTSQAKQNPKILGTSQAKPEKPATSQAKPEEPATSQAKPEEPAISQAKSEEPAISQAKQEELAISQAKPKEPAVISQAESEQPVTLATNQEGNQQAIPPAEMQELTSKAGRELASELPEINGGIHGQEKHAELNHETQL